MSHLSLYNAAGFRSVRQCIVFIFLSDPESKTLIEKLAVFVARNGHEFEKLTRSKQRHNPRFSFLFGGKHSDYYQCRLAAEKTGENYSELPSYGLECLHCNCV